MVAKCSIDLRKMSNTKRRPLNLPTKFIALGIEQADRSSPALSKTVFRWYCFFLIREKIYTS